MLFSSGRSLTLPGFPWTSTVGTGRLAPPCEGFLNNRQILSRIFQDFAKGRGERSEVFLYPDSK
jgi:hypothetical protein